MSTPLTVTRVVHPELLNRQALESLSLLAPGQPFSPTDDVVFLCGDPRPGSPISGGLILRPVYYAHSLVVLPGTLAHRTTDLLFTYADGYTSHAALTARPGEMRPAGTLFHVSRANATMQRYIESKGAVSEPDSLLYRL